MRHAVFLRLSWSVISVFPAAARRSERSSCRRLLAAARATRALRGEHVNTCAIPPNAITRRSALSIGEHRAGRRTKQQPIRSAGAGRLPTRLPPERCKGVYSSAILRWMSQINGDKSEVQESTINASTTVGWEQQ